MTTIIQNTISYIRVELEEPNLGATYEIVFFYRCGGEAWRSTVGVEWACGIATISLNAPCDLGAGYYNATLVETINNAEMDLGVIFTKQNNNNYLC